MEPTPTTVVAALQRLRGGQIVLLVVMQGVGEDRLSYYRMHCRSGIPTGWSLASIKTRETCSPMRATSSWQFTGIAKLCRQVSVHVKVKVDYCAKRSSVVRQACVLLYNMFSLMTCDLL